MKVEERSQIVHQAVGVAIGLLVVVAGAAIVHFRVPLSQFFKIRQQRQGRQVNAAQSPLSGLAVGIAWIALGLYVTIGTAAGWVH